MRQRDIEGVDVDLCSDRKAIDGIARRYHAMI